MLIKFANARTAVSMITISYPWAEQSILSTLIEVGVIIFLVTALVRYITQHSVEKVSNTPVMKRQRD